MIPACLRPYMPFMRIPLKIIPQEIIDDYNLKALVDDQGWIYMRIKKGMYGLKQAGIITNQELVKTYGSIWISSCATHTWPMGT